MGSHHSRKRKNSWSRLFNLANDADFQPRPFQCAPTQGRAPSSDSALRRRVSFPAQWPIWTANKSRILGFYLRSGARRGKPDELIRYGAEPDGGSAAPANRAAL